MRRIREKLSFSNSIALLALFVALGGSAYAASQIPKNSVGAKQLKRNAVTPSKLSDASKSTLAGPRGPKGENGPQGPVGPAGSPGATGPRATSLLAQVSVNAELVSGSGVTGVTELEKGSVLVDFDRDVSACNLEATPASAPSVAPGSLIVGPSEGDPAGVLVQRLKNAGGGTTFAFYLAVFCP